MAWEVKGNNLQMTEGDYGVALPVTISGATFSDNDEVKLTIKNRVNGTAVIEKTFSNINENTMSLVFTETESGRLHVGSYVYVLDWYQNGAFMCNIIPAAIFKVVDKA